MLRELSVRNLAVLDDVRVEFGPGFLALTGETGAGKSLLLDAVGLLLGERGSTDLIRAGADELRVTGRFELTNGEQRAAVEAILGDPLDESELILSRRLSRSGKNPAYANERPVPVATLKQLGEALVDVHGQRESHALLQPAYQLTLLDLYGKLTDKRSAYELAAGRVRDLRKRLRDLESARDARTRELKLVRFERDELTAAKLKAGEREQLERDRDRLANAQDLADFSGRVATTLYEDDGSVVETLGRLVKDGQHWLALDPNLADVVTRLDALKPELRDLAETSRDLADKFEADPARLAKVEARLQRLVELESKYAKPADELVMYLESLGERESQLQKDESDLGGIGRELDDAFRGLTAVAATLTKGRVKAAKALAAEVQKQLADLQMPKAVLTAELETSVPGDATTADVPAAGFDHFEFLLAANPGEPARPLRKVASGGELSRTMLALKTVLAAHDPVRTLVVFDEIDANVGGRLGDVLGKKLSTLGTSHQVICVTHLPQVAGYAARQWTIRKVTAGKKTATTIAELTTREERVEELAAMLRGEARSAGTRAEAAAMLKG
jgi:DNA repair protein RecN (Recombination protein N)